MRNFFRTVRFVITDWFASSGSAVKVHDPVAKAIKDSSHVGPRGAGRGAAHRSEATKLATDGAENYAKSFEKRERPR